MKNKILLISAIVVAAAVAGGLVFALQSNDSGTLDVNTKKITKQNYQIQVSDTKTIPNGLDPSFAFDEKSNNLYVSYYDENEEGSADVFMVKSSDNGKSFSDPVRVNDIDGDASAGGYTNPIQFGPNGEVYITWQQIEEHPQFYGIYNMRLAKSTDGGQSFSHAVDPAKELELSEKLYPELTVSKDGTIMMPYINNEYAIVDGETGKEITYKLDDVDYVTQMPVLRSNDGGKTFEQFILDETACQCCDIASTVGPDGEVYFVWRTSDRYYIDESNPEDKHIKYLYKLKSQEEWYEGLDDAGKKAFDEGLIGAPIKYSTARDIVISHTLDGGKGEKWSEPVRVQEKKWMFNGCISIGPGLTFDNQGRLHLSYFTGTGEDGKMGYYYVYSDDKGETFSDPIPIFSADYIAPIHNGAALTVDDDGIAWIAFMMYNDYAITDNVWETEHEMELNVFALDRNGNILDESKFPTDTRTFPSIKSTKQGTIVGYSDSVGANLVSLSLKTI
ncbi:hypothetical protein C6988_03755 [Nitrosopumilus sp. b1]|uniref:sialidase family protein n=1 Tax=Nitrosopumilus sp. b1 TaxID=2109907 RepID=UPI0015F568F6|nr:sialidase family protein [Nitrosopumilus sp. b1]KAF6243369.1 hypothetical protein C6988_03755 [Nitrosopumilus sp. b1]